MEQQITSSFLAYGEIGLMALIFLGAIIMLWREHKANTVREREYNEKSAAREREAIERYAELSSKTTIALDNNTVVLRDIKQQNETIVREITTLSNRVERLEGKA